jgi:hypothetical protein
MNCTPSIWKVQKKVCYYKIFGYKLYINFNIFHVIITIIILIAVTNSGMTTHVYYLPFTVDKLYNTQHVASSNVYRKMTEFLWRNTQELKNVYCVLSWKSICVYFFLIQWLRNRKRKVRLIVYINHRTKCRKFCVHWLKELHVYMFLKIFTYCI